jgi:hypothetical protein
VVAEARSFLVFLLLDPRNQDLPSFFLALLFEDCLSFALAGSCFVQTNAQQEEILLLGWRVWLVGGSTCGFSLLRVLFETRLDAARGHFIFVGMPLSKGRISM